MDCEIAPYAQRPPSGATTGLDCKSPSVHVYVTLKRCIRGKCFAVVKCSTDAIFCYDPYHRVVERPKRDHMPIKWLWNLEKHRARAN